MRKKPRCYTLIENAAKRLGVPPEVARAMALLAELPYKEQHRIIQTIFEEWYRQKGE